jgi:hypothetical protein
MDEGAEKAVTLAASSYPNPGRISPQTMGNLEIKRGREVSASNNDIQTSRQRIAPLRYC